MIGRAHLLRPLADPADSLGGIILTGRPNYPIVNFLHGFRPLHFQTIAFWYLPNFVVILLFVLILIRSPEILRATLTNPTGFGWSVYCAAGAKFGVLTSPNCQNRLNFIDNGLLFLLNRRYFTFLVSQSHFRRGWWHTILLRRSHEILHFDTIKLISVSTELSNLLNFYYDAAIIITKRYIILVLI